MGSASPWIHEAHLVGLMLLSTIHLVLLLLLLGPRYGEVVDLRDVVDGTVGQGKADSHSDSGSEWSMDEADIESLLETRVALDLMDPHAAVDQALLQQLDNALEALRVPPLVRLDIHLHHTGKVTSAHVRTSICGGPHGLCGVVDSSACPACKQGKPGAGACDTAVGSCSAGSPATRGSAAHSSHETNCRRGKAVTVRYGCVRGVVVAHPTPRQSNVRGASRTRRFALRRRIVRPNTAAGVEATHPRHGVVSGMCRCIVGQWPRGASWW